MTKEQFISECYKVLDKFVNNFKNGCMDERDICLYGFLKEIIVVEELTISRDILFEQLKGNYFQTDLATSLFIMKLYTKKEDTIFEYFDIYLEQNVENSIDVDDMNKNNAEMRNFLVRYFPNLIEEFDNKAAKYNTEYKA